MIFNQRVAALVTLSLLSIGSLELVKSQPASAAETVRPTILVELSYPGATAQVLADTIAVPIEQQINGVEKSVHLRSQCRNDGSYVLEIVFRENADLAAAEKLVQRRLNLALPTLPEAAKRSGVLIKRPSPGPLMLCCLYSPNNSYNDRYLSNYATTQILDALSRLPGIGDMALVPDSHDGLRVLLDAEKMGALKLTVGDVAAAIREQNAKTVARPTGASATNGKLEIAGSADPKTTFENIIVKVGPDAQAIRVRDVAKIELGAVEPWNYATRHGRPVVAMAIWPRGYVRAETVRDAVKKKVTELSASLPKDVLLDTTFDFAPNSDAPHLPPETQYLLLDVEVPNSLSAERTTQVLNRCERAARMTAGVEDTLALFENPFNRLRNQPCVLVSLTRIEGHPVRLEKVRQAIRTRLAKDEEIRGVSVMIRDFPGPAGSGGGYPVDFAISGPENEHVIALAEKLSAQLRAEELLTDLWASSDRKPESWLFLNIDLVKATGLGVTLSNVFETTEAFWGSAQLGEFNESGKSWPVIMQAGVRPCDKRESFKRLMVRSANGKLVPLAEFSELQKRLDPMMPAVINRLDLQPMVEISANPAGGTTLAEIRTRCESHAAEIRTKLGLPPTYRLIWLRPLPTAQ